MDKGDGNFDFWTYVNIRSHLIKDISFTDVIDQINNS